jgi:toxin ParE1/3/4
LSAQVTFRPRARADVLEQLVYLAERSGIDTADRYHSALLRTCELLARQPTIGSPTALTPRLRGLRRHPVGRPFNRYLIFYKPIPRGIDLWRVLHGARDIDSILFHE